MEDLIDTDYEISTDNSDAISVNNLTVNSLEHNNRMMSINYMFSNARSLSAKMRSLVVMFDELRLHFSAISETWFKDGRKFSVNVRRLEDSENLKVISKNRGSRGGGVAIVYDVNRMTLKPIKIRDNDFEIVGAAGRTSEDARRVVIFSVYYPPSMKADRVVKMNDCLSQAIDRAKNCGNSPRIFLCGDFNNKDVSTILADHPDMRVLDSPPTRNNQVLDMCITNFDPSGCDVSVGDPLVSDMGIPSDHEAMICRATSERRHIFKKRRIWVRKYTERGERNFGALLAAFDWRDIHTLEANAAVEYMDSVLSEMYDECFPRKSFVVKSTDKPWVNRAVKRASRRRRRHYKRRGKDARWEELKVRSDKRIEEAKMGYLQRVKDSLTEARSSKAYFVAINKLKSKEAPKRWEINTLFPGEDDGVIAEKCADYFASISAEYVPIPPPVNQTNCKKLELFEVAARLRYCNKPSSQVGGDIHPKLVTKFADLLAVPLLHVYNECISKAVWPDKWKDETVKLIPKSKVPESIKDVRNISCTPLFSKVLEFFVLKNLKEQMPLSNRQFGGVKGVGIDHFLCETWHEISTGLETENSAMSLLSIDFSKAFNRMDHSECIKALVEAGVDEGWTRVVQAFLHGRTMSVHINDTISTKRRVPGGAPQGSVLGCYLFCATTDRLSDCMGLM